MNVRIINKVVHLDNDGLLFDIEMAEIQKIALTCYEIPDCVNLLMVEIFHPSGHVLEIPSDCDGYGELVEILSKSFSINKDKFYDSAIGSLFIVVWNNEK